MVQGPAYTDGRIAGFGLRACCSGCPGPASGSRPRLPPRRVATSLGPRRRRGIGGDDAPLMTELPANADVPPTATRTRGKWTARAHAGEHEWRMRE